MIVITLIIFATAVASYFIGIMVGMRLERRNHEQCE